MVALRDVSGMRFGRLLVVGRAPTDARGEARWVCRCDCGGESTVRGSTLRKGETTSCGCYQREVAAVIAKPLHRSHGHSFPRSPTYMTWRAMLDRCEEPRTNGYRNYGGAGIRVCERWHAFAKFLADVGVRPTGKTLDRIDNAKGYEPGNCRWATPKEQAANRRPRRKS